MPDDEKTAADQDERSAFQRFEDFARKLIAVPKHEIDDESAKREREQRSSRTHHRTATPPQTEDVDSP
jgi:hypothetical protein